MVIVEEYSYPYCLAGPSTDNSEITLSCFMPNGLMILLKAKYNATLAEIKEVGVLL